tara:strand:+ start:596 stop:2887 length:2292 start_codon:yes stop_codon:yes gene_type:complete
LKPATKPFNKNHYVVFDVWLDIGKQGMLFIYKDGLNLGVERGDVVSVRLRGRLMNGLILNETEYNQDQNESNKYFSKDFKLSNIEKIIEKKIVNPAWTNFIFGLSDKYHTSKLKTFKTALPPGWIGKYRRSSESSNHCFWVELESNALVKKQDLTSRQYELVEFLRKSNGGVWQSLILKSGFSNQVLSKLIKDGIAKKQQRSKKTILSQSKELPFVCNINDSLPSLTKPQVLAIEKYDNLSQGQTLLLWGETGSGKTEIYMRIAEEELNRGKSCLILAPEIGLLPQLQDRFKARFGSQNILEYHSNCSNSQRAFIWKKCLETKDPLIVIGTRSSIFLPFFNLGLIVLDEEHDSSYKQENLMPCYHARDVAIYRAKNFGTKVILGSATPSIFSWKNAKPRGDFSIARIRERVTSIDSPEVKVIDMRNEFKQGHKKIFSRELISDLLSISQNKEQAIILVPRRGYGTFLSCRYCGYVVQCPNCDLSLTVHSSKKGLKWLNCHWCNFHHKYIFRCPDCYSEAFKPFGVGTQKVMEYLENEFPNLRILRFDRDTTGGRNGHREILSQFADKKADILVGTQMIAKGIDLPDVTLSVILAADGLLHRPDISAEENALQLFVQLAGRSGRFKKKGKVIVQTYKPNHPVINYLRSNDYEGFLKDSLNLRKESNLYPYCRVCLFKISGQDSIKTSNTTIKIANYLKPICLENNWKLIGAAPSLIPKVAGKFRWQIMIQGKDELDITLPIDSHIWDLIPSNVSMIIDPDPMEI